MTRLLLFFLCGCSSEIAGNNPSPDLAGAPDLYVDPAADLSQLPGADLAGVDLSQPPGPDLGPIVAPQPLSANIVVDQFGYRTVSEKIAVIRSPQMGFDAASFTPGAKYALIDAHNGAKILEAAPTAWNAGATDSSSGDKAWWFDFSSVTTPGDYYVLDEDKQLRSDIFRIADDVYREVLKHSIRMFYYQRDGIAKEAKYAGASWADGAAHLGANQGPACKLYNGATTKDLRGGWWDAGDMNKYTNWAAQDAIELLLAYKENPGAFFDDYNIPESGNGIPDLLDEVKWELDWIVRMQNSDGSVLSIVGQGDAAGNLPSTDTTACKYGPANTSATLTSAAVFALASKIYQPFNAAFASDLATRAAQAWDWAGANPNVTFNNSGTIGAGEQETDAHGRVLKKLAAAVYLYQLTSDTKYRDYVDANYNQSQLIGSNYVDMFAAEEQETLLQYARTTGATTSVANDIVAKFKSGVASDNNIGSTKKNRDPYLAFTYIYVWGSNQVKAMQGNTMYDVISYTVDAAQNADAARGAERYVHYVHGVNPLQIVYLSNMNAYGAAKSVSRFYHAWFSKGSDWDQAGVSKYGPPPGYLTGGPNPSYDWDGCCPSGCSGVSCGGSVLSPPAGQPPQKSYLDFNDSWPINSWSVTEPSDGYQAKYVRLLSKFVH